MSVNPTRLPQAFIWRRVHSLMGLWLVLFLIEHLLVNSQAALLLGKSGKGFVDMVNAIHNFPYLSLIEFTLLGVPIAIHLIWGVKYLLTGRFNSGRSDGSTPSLPEYGRNRAYSWQRITSWILLFSLIGHIVKFRFLDYPEEIQQGSTTYYLVPLKVDNGIYTVADRLGVKLYTQSAIKREREQFQADQKDRTQVEAASALKAHEKFSWTGPEEMHYDSGKAAVFLSAQKYQERQEWIARLEKRAFSEKEVLAVSDNFGAASILTVRETFKNPIYVLLYTIFVLAACFHAFNGLWTFLITWGVVLKMSAQRSTAIFAVALMLIVTFLGLISIWGTYWLNLRY